MSRAGSLCRERGHGRGEPPRSQRVGISRDTQDMACTDSGEQGQQLRESGGPGAGGGPRWGGHGVTHRSWTGPPSGLIPI